MYTCMYIELELFMLICIPAGKAVAYISIFGFLGYHSISSKHEMFILVFSAVSQQPRVCIFMYVYVHICIHMYTYVYIVVHT